MTVNLEQMLEDLPDSADLLEFDAFFVGDGSKDIYHNKYKRVGNFNDQLMGISNIKDLGKDSKESVDYVRKPDLDKWSVTGKEAKDPVQYYFEMKQLTFEVFDFIKVKSERLDSKLIRERDLILSDEDSYLLEYLIEKGLATQSRLSSLASLQALHEMGFVEFKIDITCECGICKVADKTIHNTRNTIALLSSGSDFIHNNASFIFTPVIRNRKDYEGYLDIDIDSVYIGQVSVSNLPREWADFTESLDLDGYESIKFMDFSEVEGWDGEVVKRIDKGLIVHNGYLGQYSPLDFLEKWLAEQDRPLVAKSKVEQSDQVFYYNGRKVVEKNGQYIDQETGQILTI